MLSEELGYEPTGNLADNVAILAYNAASDHFKSDDKEDEEQMEVLYEDMDTFSQED